MMTAGMRAELEVAARSLGRSSGLVCREAVALWLWTLKQGKMPTILVGDESGEMEIVKPGAT